MTRRGKYTLEMRLEFVTRLSLALPTPLAKKSQGMRPAKAKTV